MAFNSILATNPENISFTTDKTGIDDDGLVVSFSIDMNALHLYIDGDVDMSSAAFPTEHKLDFDCRTNVSGISRIHSLRLDPQGYEAFLRISSYAIFVDVDDYITRLIFTGSLTSSGSPDENALFFDKTGSNKNIIILDYI